MIRWCDLNLNKQNLDTTFDTGVSLLEILVGIKFHEFILVSF